MDKWALLRKKYNRAHWDKVPHGFVDLLPDQIALNILRQLGVKDICQAAQVSSKWHLLCTDDSVWKPLYKRRWRVTKIHPESWDVMYGQQFQRVHQGWPVARPSQRIIALQAPARAMQYEDDFAIISQNNDIVKVSLENNQAMPLQVWQGHTGPVSCLQFDERQLVSGGEDGCLKVWLLKQKEKTPAEPMINIRPDAEVGAQPGILSLRYDEARIACGRRSGHVDIWDVEEQRASLRLLAHPANVIDLQFDDTRLITGSMDGTIKQWDLRTGRDAVLTIQVGQPLFAFQYQFGAIMAGCGDGTIGVWDLRTTQETGRYASYGNPSPITTITFDDVRVIAGTTAGVVHMWARDDYSQPKSGEREVARAREEMEVESGVVMSARAIEKGIEMDAGGGKQGGVSTVSVDLDRARVCVATLDAPALYLYDFGAQASGDAVPLKTV